MAKPQQEAALYWVGDCLEVLRTFPKDIQQNFGGEIRRLQDGVQPMDSRPMKSIGHGVFELRQRDTNGWYRVIYLSKVGNTLHMLHSFVKKSAKTSRKDLSIATNRLKAVRAKLLEEKKNEQKHK